MIKEADILDLKGSLDKKIATLSGIDKLANKFQCTLMNLKVIEEQRLKEIESLANVIAQFYNKDCIYKDYTDMVAKGLEKEKLEIEQTVS